MYEPMGAVPTHTTTGDSWLGRRQSWGLGSLRCMVLKRVNAPGECPLHGILPHVFPPLQTDCQTSSSSSSGLVLGTAYKCAWVESEDLGQRLGQLWKHDLGKGYTWAHSIRIHCLSSRGETVLAEEWRTYRA